MSKTRRIKKGRLLAGKTNKNYVQLENSSLSGILKKLQVRSKMYLMSKLIKFNSGFTFQSYFKLNNCKIKLYLINKIYMQIDEISYVILNIKPDNSRFKN